MVSAKASKMFLKNIFSLMGNPKSQAQAEVPSAPAPDEVATPPAHAATGAEGDSTTPQTAEACLAKTLEISQEFRAQESAFAQAFDCAKRGDVANALWEFANWAGDRAPLDATLVRHEDTLRVETAGNAPLANREQFLRQISEGVAFPDTVQVAATLAVARNIAVRDTLAEAHRYVREAVADPLRNKWTQYALHTYEKLQEGIRLPRMFELFFKEGETYNRSHVCTVPFDRFDITSNGNVLLCCGSFLPTRIGNVTEMRADQVINSDTAIRVRRSTTDGSFTDCNWLTCTTIAGDFLKPRDGMEIPSLSVDGPKSVLFGIDRTCNLACPQCRVKFVSENNSTSHDKYEAALASLLPLLTKTKLLTINPSGEVFASRISRKVLSQINSDDNPDLTINLMTNGTLFSEMEWDKFKNIHDHMGFVRVSIDAVTEETYNKIRVGGNFKKLQENLKFISKLRKQGTIQDFQLLFVYQKDNVHEMADFAKWGEELGADLVIYQRIVPLGSSAFQGELFEQQCVHLPDHPLRPVLNEQLQRLKQYKGLVCLDHVYTIDPRTDEVIDLRQNPKRLNDLALS